MQLKTNEEIKIMHEGGKKLAQIRDTLGKAVAPGVTALDIEYLACDLIDKTGGEPSFKKVPGYSWATCVNVNDGIVHGIPKKEIVFKKGDIVSVDVGLFYKGFHTDTSLSVGLDVDADTEKFLKAGRDALNNAIKQAKIGNRISDISRQMQDGVEKYGYSPIRSLVGHGIGRNLHEEPHIPCFVPKSLRPSPKLVEGMVIAIEIMYALGTDEIKYMPDKWTIVTADGTISALYEETVAIVKNGPLVLTGVN